MTEMCARIFILVISWFLLSFNTLSAQTNNGGGNKATPVSNSGNVVIGQWTLEPESALYIKGTSNVNKFECACTETFAPQAVRFEFADDPRIVFFHETSIVLTTRMLDCGDKRINKDMYETLHADQHPEITIQIFKAIQDFGELLSECETWVEMETSTAMTIAGERRLMNLPIRAQNLGDGRYRFSCEKKFCLTDFNIDPPKALLGLIKVNDEMTLHLDLIVKMRSN